jgi:hypothetical protein
MSLISKVIMDAQQHNFNHVRLFSTPYSIDTERQRPPWCGTAAEWDSAHLWHELPAGLKRFAEPDPSLSPGLRLQLKTLDIIDRAKAMLSAARPR